MILSFDKNSVANYLLVFLLAVLPLCWLCGIVSPDASINNCLWGLVSAVAINIAFFKENKTAYSITHPAIICLLLLIGWLSYSVIYFSINKAEAAGTVLRYAGIAMSIVFFSNYFSANTFSIKQAGYWSVVGIALLLSAAGIALIKPVYDYFSNGTAIIITAKSFPALGNKNFFCEKIAVLIPIGLWVAMITKGKMRMAVLLIISAALLLMIWMQSVAAMVAAVMAVIILGISYLLLHKIINKKTIVLVLMFFLLSGIALLMLLQHSDNERLHTIVQLFTGTIAPAAANHTNSIQERIYLWHHTAIMIKENIWRGVGVNNWIIFFPKYGIPEPALYNGGTQRFQHPHNEFLHLLAEAGMVGLLLMLLFFTFVFYSAYKKIRAAATVNEQLGYIALLCGIVAYGVICMFSLPATQFGPLQFLAVYISALIATSPAAKQPWRTYSKLVLLLMIPVLLAVGYVNYKRYNGEIKMQQAFHAQIDKDWKKMKTYVSKAESAYYKTDDTGTPIEWYKGFASFYINDTTAAFNSFISAAKTNPNHVQVLNDLGTCYYLQGNKQMAMYCYNKALHLLPGFEDALVNKSILLFNENRKEEAFQLLYQCRNTSSMRYINTLQEFKSLSASPH